jgi:BirA family biotin operon repressor/biotin-[acetyl-CoA-carboxylase] ligase
LSLPDPLPAAAPLPPDLAAGIGGAADRLLPVCRELRWYAEVTSTSDVAAAFADAGAPEGTVVIADAQTAGRGRQRRSWASPAGAGLYVSIVLRPDRQWIGLLTIAAGVALAEGIASAAGLHPILKWPNDLVVRDAASGGLRKLAGILAEASSGGTSPAPGCVLGFGINLTPAAYPADVAVRVTSLEHELGRPVERATVLVECMRALAARYDDLRCGRDGAVLAAWRAFAGPLLGCRVEWDGPDGPRRGVADDIDVSGALVVRSDEGIERVIAGDVRWT